MEREVLNLTYASSLTDLCEINSSFDTGVLAIAYHGLNRNGSYISKTAFEKGLETIYNVPIVCNYNREDDTLGGHDVELVRKDDGELYLANLTDPIGVIPESANTYWKTVTEKDGTSHEYLCAEAILWKRQEAYKKIKSEGITMQSMEINVKDGEFIDGVYHITDFEFTAFTLIGVEPCFESASLSFAKENFKQQFSEMMLELKESFSKVNTSLGVNDTEQTQHSTEGGSTLNKSELIEKYGVDVESLDFSIDDYTAEELEEKFQAMLADKAQEEGTKDVANIEETPEDEEATFALTSTIVEEIGRALRAELVRDEYGDEWSRYCIVDTDFELSEVYCWDVTDWLLYGFTYQLDGDNVLIDFESRKRMKYVIAEFDEGEQKSPFIDTFNKERDKLREISEQYENAKTKIASMQDEITSLSKFRLDAESKERHAILDKFDDLEGIEAFAKLRENCDEYTLEELEDKCYALRGRHNTKVNFSMGHRSPKLPIESNLPESTPYNGVFEEYGFEKK